MRFAVIAGEASGDLLGAPLIEALRGRYPQATFYGVTGPRMREAGCESLSTIDALSVMGIAEVLPKLPAILKLRRELVARLLVDRPDCVIGIDAPDFNLGLERTLKQAGIAAVHVVSPSVWAWRRGRVKSIAQSVDLMLCLLPFEARFYEGHGVTARYIGHPLAETLGAPIDRKAARVKLGLVSKGPVVAVLPGSRGGELKYLAEPFAQTAAWLAQRLPEVSFVTPLAKPALRAPFEAAIASHAAAARWTLVDGQSREAMRAADAVLLASGTATLECLLLDRPMVVAYRMAPVTAWIARRLVKSGHFALPNLLCAEPVVPEYFQEEAPPEVLGESLLALLTQVAARARQLDQFEAVRRELKRDAATHAASAIADLLTARGQP